MKLPRIAGLVAGLVLLLPAPAVAAEVSIRVEGSQDTLVPRTRVAITPGTVNKDGVAGHDCSGTSAAGALERATGGDWDGTWFPGFRYTVDRVRSEAYPFPSDSFWSFWRNGRFSSTGICDTELSNGDELLFFPTCAAMNCDGPEPLRLTAPATIAPGRSFEVRVTELLDLGANVGPAPGATVTAGAATFTTGADGVARIPAQRSDISLRATKPGRVRSATETVCVSTGADGRCGSRLDRAAPQVRLFTPKHDRRPYRRGPRRIAGAAVEELSALRHVKLRLNRKHRGRCYAYGSRAERFRGVRCGAGWWFSIGSDERWSYLLPERLPAGRYVLRAVAIDGAGNRSRVRTGINRVTFRVR